MERRLSLLPDLGFEPEPVEEVKVAVTTFAYNNGDAIHLLRKRGQMIKSEDWEGMKKIDAQINIIKGSNLEDFTTPCSIFMSFENEEGVNRAVRYNDLIASNPEEFEELKLWLNKYTINIKKASEPTDIIWENRQFS